VSFLLCRPCPLRCLPPSYPLPPPHPLPNQSLHHRSTAVSIHLASFLLFSQ
jgi:hypothetical protein